MLNQVVSISDDVMRGTAVFEGTHVLIETLFDYIEGQETIDEFLEDFPTVSKA